MTASIKSEKFENEDVQVASRLETSNDDDKELLALGYKPSFKREFTSLATISFAFSIMGLCSSVATTFNSPLLLGGPATVVWCWILGACVCFTLGASIAEIVSAYPTCGGLYTASAHLTPKRYRAEVGWLVGWLNILGQIAGCASTEFGLANMIWAAVSIGQGPQFVLTSGKTVGLFAGMMVVHGILNSLATRHLARLAKGFVFVNLGTTFIIIIVLLATTPRSEMHSASYVFGSAGMTDYDATAHISEEVQRAAYAAPSAIVIAVLGTGIIGWLLNIVLVLCSGPLENLPGPSGSAFLQIMVDRMGKAGALILWVPVCLTAFFVVQTALQATSRVLYAFSRDHGLPDRGFFGVNSRLTDTPLRSVWLATAVCILLGLLDLASPIAANAIFSLTPMALDASYIIPIFLRRINYNHPEVQFKPGPFSLGDGIIGNFCNWLCIIWTCFITVIFSLPTVFPVTKDNMNYASAITGGVVLLSLIWYFISGRKHYHGPQSNLRDHSTLPKDDTAESSLDGMA